MCLLLIKHPSFSIISLNISTGYWTMSGTESYPIKTALQQIDTVVQCEVLKKIISYWRLKTQKHSVRIGFSCSGFSFYEHFNRQFNYAVFYIQNWKMCLSKMILCQYFVGCFFLVWDRFSSGNISLHCTKNLIKI